jgi:hypothetical protein
MKQAKITRTLEDGTLEVTYIDLPDKDSNLPVEKKTIKKKRKNSNADNTKQEEVKTTSTSKASIKITRPES